MAKDRRFNKVLLFILPDFLVNISSIPERPYSGIGYIAEALGAEGIVVKGIDCRFDPSLQSLFSAIREFQPDIIGTTIGTKAFRRKYKVAERIKKEFPYLPILFGGPHVECYGARLMEEALSVDFAIVGEGERAVVRLCNEANENVPNLYYRDSGQVKFTYRDDFIQNLDSLGFPKFRAFDMSLYPDKVISLYTSRGCYGNCTFCTVGQSMGKKMRGRSVESVTDEVRYWYTKGIRDFYVNDDMFVFSRKRVTAICEAFRREFPDIELRLNNGVRADRVDYEMLKQMYDAGFRRVSYGVESANDDILKHIKKGETLDEIKEAVRLSVEIGYHVNLFNILGLPYETPEHIMRTIQYAAESGANTAEFFNLIPYPGTELYKWAVSNGYLLWAENDDYLNLVDCDKDHVGIPVLNTPELSYDQRVALSRVAEKAAIDIAYAGHSKILRKKLGFLLGYLSSYLYNNRLVRRLTRDSFFFNKMVRKIRGILRV